MIKTVLLFLPCMTCLFWLALNPLVHKKDKQFKALELLSAVTGIALFAEAGLTCTTGNAMLTLFLIKQFSALLIIPVAFLFIRSLSTAGEKQASIQAFIAVPVSLLAAQIILLILTGSEGFIQNATMPVNTDKAGLLIHICSFVIFYAVLAVEALMFWVFSIIRAIKRNYSIQILHATAVTVIYAILQISVIYEFQLWFKAIISVILAAVLFMLSYSGMAHSGEIIEHTVVTEHIPDHPTDKPADIHQSAADEESLRIRFEDLIVSEQLFLKQGVRLADIAAMLDTNRTYVSRLVNNTYNMSFSDYINTLRIDYAEQYLLHHRDAKQTDIATACGFPNASAFNNVFKKITGVTPKIWLATRS